MKYVSELWVASLLAYPTRGRSEASQRAQAFIRYDIKQSKAGRIERTVERLTQVLDESPIADVLRNAGMLVPIPGHTPRYASALWVAERISHALLAQGIGIDAQPLLVRTEVVPKSSSRRAASDRVDPPEHYRTLSVQRPLVVPERITLVDDVVTRGSTLIAAATRVVEAFPGIEVRAFALARVESSLEIERVEEMLSPACEVVRYSEASGILERRKG